MSYLWRDVSVRLGRVLVLDRVRATTAGGPGVVAVVGPNGAGKTTLLRTLAGLIPCESGELSVASAPSEIRFVETGRRFPARMKVAEVLDFEAWLLALPLGGIEARRWLTSVGCEALLGRRMGEISAGQTRIVQLASAAMGDPKLVLLDEPFTALDTSARALLRSRIGRMAESCTVVFVTHDLGEVELLAAHVVALRAGRNEFDGPIAAFRAHRFSVPSSESECSVEPRRRTSR